MGFWRLQANLFSILAAALAGNWVGEQLRYILTGERDHELRLVQTQESGENFIGINPLLTNLVPGVAAGLLERPSWFFAFLGGALASALLGSRYEEQFSEWLKGFSSPVQSGSQPE
jgi:hypothetical protein